MDEYHETKKKIKKIRKKIKYCFRRIKKFRSNKSWITKKYRKFKHKTKSIRNWKNTDWGKI